MRFRSDPAVAAGFHRPRRHPVHRRRARWTWTGLRRLISWQLDSGSHGISLGGSTGEPSAQTLAGADRRDDRGCRGDRGPGAVPARHRLGQAGRDARADRGSRRAGRRRRAGDHAVLRPADPGGPVPVVRDRGRAESRTCRSWSTTSRPAPPSTSPRRPSPGCGARFDNIVGVKETTRDFEHFSRVLHACGRDILVWSGIELLCLPLLALGGVGFVSAVANMAPGGGRADVRALDGRRAREGPGAALRAASRWSI